MAHLQPPATSTQRGMVTAVTGTGGEAEMTARRAAASGYSSLNASSRVEQLPDEISLRSFSGLVPAADRLPYYTGASSMALATYTAFARTLDDDSDAATARTTLGLGAADSPTFGGITVTGPSSFSGRVSFTGPPVEVQMERLNVAANYILMNEGYTADAAQSAGLVANYDPTTTTTTAAGAGFTAGVAATSDATVEVTSTAGFAGGDIVHVSGSISNDGLYEVQALLAGPARLQLRGQLNAVVELFTRDQVTTEAHNSATVVKTNVSVMRVGTDGVMELGAGAVTGITYRDIVDRATDASLAKSGAGLATTFSAVGAITGIEAGDTANAGTAVASARGDHQHAVATGVVSNQTITTAAEGSATNLARADHIHSFSTAAPAASGSLAAGSSVGTSTSFARADHVHSTDPGSNGVAMGTTTNRWDVNARNLNYNGAVNEGTTPVSSSPYTVLATDGFLYVDASGTNPTVINLPALSGSGARRQLKVMKVDSSTNPVRLDGSGAETINGVATRDLTAQYEMVTLTDRTATDWAMY